jgi:protein involved in polysaccharide export with SLBB domain
MQIRMLCTIALAMRLLASVEAQVESVGANLPAQAIGPADMLAISVYGAPEFTRTARVSAEGLIRLPMLREQIDAMGLMPEEVETRIAAALEQEQILVDPAVTVTIAEYHSRPISVLGAVKSPLTFRALGKTTLLEALTRAQGLSEDAGPEILLTRTAGGAGSARVEHIPVRKLIDAADPVWNVTLDGGEEVRVPQAGRVFVAGNVKHPGAFRMDGAGDTTVLKALALAEGLAPFATKDAYIFRPGPRSDSGSDSGGDVGRTEISVALSKIMERTAPDVPLGANDILYVESGPSRGAIAERYFHFDSWRVNAGESLWVPAQIYVEEQASVGRRAGEAIPHFKAQTRFWDYSATPSRKADELTSILIESASAVKDPDAPKDVSPLESQRSWERQAEQNLLARLEKGGLLAPPGPVEEVLNTVTENLIVSSKLDIEAHCRVLLTTPFETFTMGHTIIISRGLIDVLPDEASLALALASELAQIALGHATQTRFAFNNQTMLSDLELLQRFRFDRPAEEMQAASEKAIAMIRASPYSNLANAGLFLKALAAHRAAMPRLLQASLGDQVADAAALARLASFTVAAPSLETDRLDQIAALPLGSRVKLNPWTNQLALVKTRPLTLLSPREKMPFEVTPFVLYLTRTDALSAEK